MATEAIKYPWRGYTEPFCIFGNLYFVGTVPASTHLIDTGEGLILIDPGYPQSLYLVIDNIYRLGFTPHDIRYILITHGHYDHLGGAKALQELTGAKTLIGREDAAYASGKVDLTWARELGTTYYEAFEPDILLGSGDTLRLGNTEILCRAAPGHTPGTLAFFFDVTDGTCILRAAMHGGVGTNSMKKAFLEEYGLSHETRDHFIPAIDALIDEHVDILLGNHTWNNQTVEKGRRITPDSNPFIDPDAWRSFLTSVKAQYRAMLEKEQAGKEMK